MMTDGNTNEPTPLVSVVILTFNEERNIHRCLTSLIHQDFAQDKFEILVVDNGSTDSTCNIVKFFIDSFKNFYISLIHSQRNNLGGARNLGVYAARAEFIAFTDADCSVPVYWISSLYNGFQKYSKTIKKLAAVGGGNLPPRNYSSFYNSLILMTQTFFGHFGSTQSKIFSKTSLVDHLSTVNVLYHKPSVIQAGSFSSAFSEVCEDVFLSYALKRNGFSLLMLKDTDVTHFMDDSFSSWAQRMFRFGRGQMNVCAFFPKHFGMRLFLPIVFLCGMIFSFVLSPFFISFLLLPISYFLFLFVLSSFLCRGKLSSKSFLFLILQFLITHFSYAAGELLGLLHLIYRNGKNKLKKCMHSF